MYLGEQDNCKWDNCHLYPFMPSGLFYLNSLDKSISYIRGVWTVFIIMFVEISELNASSVDPDQPLRSAAYDPGLHCLPMTHLCRVDSSTKSLDRFICYISSVFFFIIVFCRSFFQLNASSVDPDQMLRSAASDPGLHFVGQCPIMLSGPFYLTFLDRSISCISGAWLILIIIMFCRSFWT